MFKWQVITAELKVAGFITILFMTCSCKNYEKGEKESYGTNITRINTKQRGNRKLVEETWTSSLQLTSGVVWNLLLYYILYEEHQHNWIGFFVFCFYFYFFLVSNFIPLPSLHHPEDLWALGGSVWLNVKYF